MASEVPMCLIENVKGQMRLNQKALKILSAITKPVVVVAIVGLYRTGKSYLMNKLAGKNTGFSLGSTVQSHTKGIWMWCVPHPQKPDHALVLLDTEGLGDVEKGDNQNDCWIFALAILLSSTFVYNSMGAINQQALDQLHYVTELTNWIRAKASPNQEDEVEDSAEFVSFFPDFVWVLRDMTLRLEADGQSLTADEYLENSLKLKQGTSEEDENYNLPQFYIRKFFPRKKCFVFYPPTDWRKFSELESLHNDELDSDFVQQVAEFCSFVFSSSKTKALPGGIEVNGAQLGILVQTYIDSINSGTLPCLENAVMILAEHKNQEAVQKATECYSVQIAQKLRLPTDTLQELLDVHAACEKEAIAVFMEHSFKDDKREFQKKLVATIEEYKENFMQQNEAASRSYCLATLEKLAKSLRESISRGDFYVPGGHRLYLEARKKVEHNYERVPKKGVKATEVFQDFLKSEITIEASILQSDKAFTDGQKAMAAEQAKKEVAEKEVELRRQQQTEQEQVKEAQKITLSENMAKLKKKMERDMENLLREKTQELKVLKELLPEGVGKQYDGLRREAKQREKEIETIPRIVEWGVSVLHDTLVNVLSSTIKRFFQGTINTTGTSGRISSSLLPLHAGLNPYFGQGLETPHPPIRCDIPSDLKVARGLSSPLSTNGWNVLAI
ncbi:guanylate-binding protein 4-like [Arvicola amphibius]|uniref:guanylate-binding protein 4-like n=1 Tax=Arvicola amphibius TaxID=1047088 RepID=UPI001C097C6A|nr:guanylate-binding protein 4-like [Arvicola amphibius]